MKRSYDDLLAEDHTPQEDDSETTSVEGDVPPYDLEQESKPSSPVYTQEYEHLRDKIHALVDLFRQPIQEATYRDGIVDGLFDEIKKRTTSTYPEQVRIGLVGDMSSGEILPTIMHTVANRK